MTLDDIIQQLSNAELSNVFRFDDDATTVSSDTRKKLIPQVNLGLQLLHQRFFLKEGTEVINMQEGVFTYPLQNPDVLRIESVKDLDDNEYLLDVPGEPDAIIRKNTTTLGTPPTMEPTTLIVTYRAGPEKLDSMAAYPPPNTVSVDLPDPYLEPLVYFVASRFMNAMGVTEGFHEGNHYLSLYERACQRLEQQNYDLDRFGSHDRFHHNGWV